MQQSIFHPRTQTAHSTFSTHRFYKFAQVVFFIALGVMPLIFLPGVVYPLAPVKTLWVLGAAGIATLLLAFVVLREGEVPIRHFWPLAAFLALAGVYALAALFSADVRDAFLGTSLEVHTAGFLFLMAFVMTISTALSTTRRAAFFLCASLCVSLLGMLLFHALRLFDPSLLSLGVFTQASHSPLLTVNGVAMFAGAMVLVLLLALVQLSLARSVQLFGLGLGLATLALAAVFYYPAIWWVLGAVSLVVLLYHTARRLYWEQHAVSRESAPTPLVAVIFAALVFATSTLFVVTGDEMTRVIGDYTGVGEMVVRPTTMGTLEVAREVLTESPVLGVGPNQFVDAWRLYKDPSILESPFWNTAFPSGSSYLSTALVTTGVLGATLWLLFFGSLVYYGIRFQMRSAALHATWRFIGSASFVGAMYIWGLTFFASPPGYLLLLGAGLTGMFLGAYARGVEAPVHVVSVANARVYGVLLVIAVVAVVGASAGSLFLVGKQYISLVHFNAANADAEAANVSEVVARLEQAYATFANDEYLRAAAQYRLQELTALLETAGEEDVTDRAAEIAQAGLAAAGRAVALDPGAPRNHLVEAQLMGTLAAAGVEGARSRAADAVDRARQYDPHNPAIDLFAAQLAFAAGENDRAREHAQAAVEKKPNYVAALLFLTDIDIAEDNLDAALARAESILSLEPNNPARYYQYGVLASAAGARTQAIQAFEAALSLAPEYANARYLLATAYAEEGRTDDALAQLRILQRGNPENELVAEAISRLQNGQSIQSLEPRGLSDDARAETAPSLSPAPAAANENAALPTAESR